MNSVGAEPANLTVQQGLVSTIKELWVRMLFNSCPQEMPTLAILLTTDVRLKLTQLGYAISDVAVVTPEFSATFS